MPVPDSVRLFVAIEVPGSVREALEPLRKAFEQAGMAPVRVDQIHLTLAFIGQLESHGIPGLESALATAVCPPHPGVAAIGAGIFGAPSHPRVGWVGISDPAGDLQRLQRRVWHACEPFIAEPESREFRPHLTLARSRKNSKADGAAIQEILTKWREFRFAKWTATEIVLFSSEPGRGGHVHHQRSIYPLG